MDLNYVVITVHNINDQLNFYTDKLGMHIKERSCFSDKEYVKLEGGTDQGTLMVFENNEENFRSTVILNTEDFLKDHYRLKERGIKFLTEPEYTNAGLAAAFMDAAENYWILLEERDYSDINDEL